MKVKINGQEVTFFTAGSITLKLDSIASTFSLKCRFMPENDKHKELFKPLQYHNIEIFNSKGKLLLTGTILNHSFVSDSGKNLIVISGYSICGILEDVTIPQSLYPLENTNLSLKQIAQKLCNNFGIGLVVGSNAGNLNIVAVDTDGEDEVNITYKKTVASPTDTCKGYLSKLTSQRNIILSHNAKGDVVLFKPNANAKPKYFFNSENSLRMTADYNGQALHSSISVLRQPSEDNEGVSTVDSITNPLIPVNRPTTKILSSGEDTDTSKAANNELASELKAIARTVELKGLFDDLYPGDLVNIHSHETYSFAYSLYMVSEITLNFDEIEDYTSISLVLPETYTGQQPKNILFYYKSHLNDN